MGDPGTVALPISPEQDRGAERASLPTLPLHPFNPILVPALSSLCPGISELWVFLGPS